MKPNATTKSPNSRQQALKNLVALGKRSKKWNTAFLDLEAQESNDEKEGGQQCQQKEPSDQEDIQMDDIIDDGEDKYDSSDSFMCV
jgi:hypothetical protein